LRSSQTTLVLASGSPQRRRLLEEAGYQFQIVVPDDKAERGLPQSLSAAEFAIAAARRKAADVVQQLTPGQSVIVVACDTVAECEGQILGKPIDRDDARRMLELLSGREHEVKSGLCLWPVPEGTPQVRLAVTRMRMDELSGEQIEDYLASGQWQGKSGAFGYQDRPGWLEVVEGSESNVIGLPMELLAEMLSELA